MMIMQGALTAQYAHKTRNSMALAGLLWGMSLGYAVSGPPDDIQLRFEHSEEIADRSHDFTEVSGLSLASDGGFWAVSDDTARLFRLDESGKVQKKLSVDAKPGLEGIARDIAGRRVLAVREDTTEILVFPEVGGMIRHPVLSMAGAGGLAPHFSADDENDGLEGITTDPETGTVYVIKERRPRLLIKIAPDLERVQQVIALTERIGFASDHADDDHLDVSGLAWDAGRRGLWITSDTGKALYFFSMDRMQARAWGLWDDKGKTPGRVANAEGVALGAGGQTLFVVTDDGRNSRLLTYRID